jgi:hypothetical protein
MTASADYQMVVHRKAPRLGCVVLRHKPGLVRTPAARGVILNQTWNLV